jgi:putative DNA primase/helicase
MEPVTDYIDDPLLDEEVNEALKQNNPAMIWGMTATLAAMDIEVYQINRAAIKKWMKDISLTALDKAVKAKQPVEEDEPEEKEAPPNDIAEKLLKTHDFINVSDNLYEYDGKKWVPIAVSRLSTLALQADGKKTTTKNRRSEITSYITSKIYTNKHEWRQIQPYEVPVANGVIDIRTMKMRPHRKEDYLQTCIPWEYSEKAQCPELMRCLDNYFGKDHDGDLKIAALQEYFGYCLMPHARYKKALLCVGESDCGKSTIPFLLRQLLGGENIAAVSVEHMDDDRKRAPLLGKLVNLLTELTSDALIADGGFKTLVSTEEPILFDPKHLAPVMDIPICKHVIVTNKKPRINDKSNATYRRLLLIHFNYVIPLSEQDTTVWDKLKAEITGILSWALEGACRLHENGGKFSDPGAEEIAEYRNDQNPMLTFIDHYCERDQYADTRTSVFIERFKSSIPGRWSASSILDLAREAGLEVEKNPTSEGAGAKYRHVKGIRIT